MRFVVFALVLGLACGELIGTALWSCSPGVGLAAWRQNGWIDSRSENNQIVCGDGLLPTQRGITATSSFTQWSVVLRSLGVGLRRQGFIFTPLHFSGAIVQLVGACITDSQPPGAVQVSATGVLPYLLDGCAGLPASTEGAPRFSPRTDDGAVTDDSEPGLRHGWQIRNPPSALRSLNAPFGCNFYSTFTWGCDLVEGLFFGWPYLGVLLYPGYIHPFSLSFFADSSGLGTMHGWDNGSSEDFSFDTAACTSDNEFCDDLYYTGNSGVLGSPGTVAPQFAGTFLEQLYGGKSTVVQSYVSLPLVEQANPPVAVGPTGVTWFAHFVPQQQGSALAFQLACGAGVTEDETKYITFSFLSSGDVWQADSGYLNVYPLGLVTPPTTVEATVLIRATCQNVATDTPTPPLYPQAPAPSPGAPPAPLTPASANSITVIIVECTSTCQDATWRDATTQAIAEKCEQNGNVGCNVQITCTLTPDCEEGLSTTSLVARRGLRQATLTFWKTTIFATTKLLATAQFLANAVRGGELAPFVNAFSGIRISYTDGTGTTSNVPFVGPSAAAPIASWPSPQASWTGSCEVYGTCRSGGCVGTCSNLVIRRVSDFAGGADILCSCKTCEGSVILTQYYFVSFLCGGAGDQTSADTCCRLVMQDAVCWALSTPGFSQTDREQLQAGNWLYRPPSIGNPTPRPVKTDGPTSCPNSSNSSKGLLGLLGLLGIIPIVLCCLLLLLCLIRRKKREGDVHFATFDAHQGAPSFNVGTGACPSVPL
jgi:hypothetical protein